MFGPDYCGVGNDKVHFILQHNINNNYIEKSFNDSIHVELDKNTHLYTLVLYNNNKIEFYIDMELKKSGSLLTHLNPGINPEKYIDDPNDIKPIDWIDDANYPDPTAVKPLDWDDDAVPKIPNPLAIKPLQWDDNIPEMIPNPDAIKPKDWLDEEVYYYYYYYINILILLLLLYLNLFILIRMVFGKYH